MFGAFVAELGQVQIVKEVFAGAEQDRGNRDMELVDQSGTKVLANDRHSSAKADVATAGGIHCLPQRAVDVIDEPELRSALHDDGSPGVMRQHEDRSVVGRIVAPPSLPR